MAYNDNITWVDLIADIEMNGRTMKDALQAGEEAYREWLSFRAARDHGDIATELEVTEGAVDDLHLAYLVLHDLFDCADNQTVAAIDRFSRLRKFT